MAIKSNHQSKEMSTDSKHVFSALWSNWQIYSKFNKHWKSTAFRNNKWLKSDSGYCNVQHIRQDFLTNLEIVRKYKNCEPYCPIERLHVCMCERDRWWVSGEAYFHVTFKSCGLLCCRAQRDWLMNEPRASEQASSQVSLWAESHWAGYYPS